MLTKNTVIIDNALKLHRLERDKLKKTMQCEKTINGVKDHEKPHLDEKVTETIMETCKMTLPMISCEEIKKELIKDLHLAKREAEVIAACHDLAIESI